MSKQRKKIHPFVPLWVGVVYVVLAIITILWAMYLAVELPREHLSSHWDLAWVGFDVGLGIALATTGWLAVKRSELLVMAATVTATILLVDAWFDIATARGGSQLYQSIALAIFGELPLAIISYRLAYVILSRELIVSPKPDFHL